MTGTVSARMLAPAVSIPPLYNGNEAAGAGGRSVPKLSIAGLNLFGTSNSSAEVPDVISENAPETRLRLVLNGIAMAARAEQSSAIVSEGPNGQVQWYRVGDQLPGDAQLVEVKHDQILLRREGRIETLRFPLDSDRIEPASEVRRTRTPQSKEEFVAEAQSRLAENPAGALAVVGFSARDGSGSGGYVYDGSNPMLNSMNLRSGDIVLAVNGQALGDAESDRDLIQQWSEQKELQIEVERNNSRFSVVVPIP